MLSLNRNTRDPFLSGGPARGSEMWGTREVDLNQHSRYHGLRAESSAREWVVVNSKQGPPSDSWKLLCSADFSEVLLPCRPVKAVAGQVWSLELRTNHRWGNAAATLLRAPPASAPPFSAPMASELP